MTTVAQLAKRLDKITPCFSEGSVTLNAISKNPSILSTIVTADSNEPRARRMMNADGVECVWAFTAILLDSKLLPHYSRRLNKKVLDYSLQKIKVTGYGASSFDEAYRGLQLLMDHMDREFGQGILTLPSPLMDTDYLGLSLSNKYVTARSSAPTAVHVLFTGQEDPKGVLSDIGCMGFVRTEHNVVSYRQLDGFTSGQPRASGCRPERFQPFDIIEVHFKAVAFPSKNRGYALELVLKEIIRLESGPTLIQQGVQAQLEDKDQRKKQRLMEDDEMEGEISVPGSSADGGYPVKQFQGLRVAGEGN